MPSLCKRSTDVSLIIPVYNLEHHIQPMLDSLAAQRTDYATEIIFVLNNCTDRSEDIIRASGIGEILYCTKQGCGCARNVGLDHSTGEYIWFLDGDDWLLSDTAIQEALDVAQGHDLIRVGWESNRFTLNYFSMVWQYVIRSTLAKSVRFPDYQPSEDDAYMEKILAQAGYNRYNFMYLPTTSDLYFYNYLRDGSNMQRYLSGEKI